MRIRGTSKEWFVEKMLGTATRNHEAASAYSGSAIAVGDTASVMMGFPEHPEGKLLTGQVIEVHEDTIVVETDEGEVTIGREDLEGPPRFRHIVVYDLERAWGGPEEGGWWYDHGTVIQDIEFRSLPELEVWLGAIWDVYAPDVEESRSYTSIIGGCDYEVRFSYEPGKDFPEERPHYE